MGGPVRPAPAEFQNGLAIGCQLQPVLPDWWAQGVPAQPLQSVTAKSDIPHKAKMRTKGCVEALDPSRYYCRGIDVRERTIVVERRHVVISKYIAEALHRAPCRIVDNGLFCGTVAGLPGVIATGKTLEICRDQLVELIEEWLLVRVAQASEFPASGSQCRARAGCAD